VSYWLGCDPGGKDKFGVAKLFEIGGFETFQVSSVDEVLKLIPVEPLGVGIDCPLWWSSGVGGGRKADKWLRDSYRLSGGQVQSVNSLRGAAVVQGVLLAMKLREKFPRVRISEAHPKALLKAMELKDGEAVASTFRLEGQMPWTKEEDVRDALLAAVAAREGFSGNWKLDLSMERFQSELDPTNLWFGAVSYWWPHTGTNRITPASAPPSDRTTAR
jgi:Protein of unknown function (DUF429)